MSLSLLNAYNSSDESDNEEEDRSKMGAETSESNSSLKPDVEKGKNFFVVDSDSDSDEEEQESDNVEIVTPADNSDFSTPFAMGPAPVIMDQPFGPLPPSYDQPHPSQMYNYAGYSQDSNPDQQEDEPSTKRRRFLTDEQAKELIKKNECESWNMDLPEGLEIIDANVDSHLENVRENLLMNITRGPLPAAASSSDGDSNEDKKPSGLAKRKHQITYLAYLAKANEDKLKNEWAKNRLTKRQTQAKYGF